MNNVIFFFFLHNKIIYIIVTMKNSENETRVSNTIRARISLRRRRAG